MTALMLALAILAARPAAADYAAVALTQVSEMDGNPVERATVGVAAPARATLPFFLAIDFRCPVAAEQAEIFVSIADTTRIDDVTGSAPPRYVELEVPLKRLEWLDEPARTCATVGEKRAPDEVAEDGTRFFRLHAGAAAYATVTCRRQKAVPATATSSAPLDVWLSCPAAGDEDPPPPATTIGPPDAQSGRAR